MCNSAPRGVVRDDHGQRFAKVWPVTRHFSRNCDREARHRVVATIRGRVTNAANQRYLAIPGWTVSRGAAAGKLAKPLAPMPSARRGSVALHANEARPRDLRRREIATRRLGLPDDALPRMESYVAYEVEDNTPRPRRENLRVTVTFHVGGDADSRVVGGSSSSATAGRAKSIKPATVSAAVYQGLQYSERPRSPLVAMNSRTPPRPGRGIPIASSPGATTGEIGRLFPPCPLTRLEQGAGGGAVDGRTQTRATMAVSRTILQRQTPGVHGAFAAAVEPVPNPRGRSSKRGHSARARAVCAPGGHRDQRDLGGAELARGVGRPRAGDRPGNDDVNATARRRFPPPPPTAAPAISAAADARG